MLEIQVSGQSLWIASTQEKEKQKQVLLRA